MTARTKKSKAFLSLVLLGLLLLPTAVQFIHTLDAHNHFECTEKSVHIHKKVVECNICDFHFFSFSYDIYEYSDLAKTLTPSKLVASLRVIVLTTFINNNTSLRGPPQFLA
ncbi:hypothetical protein CLV91_0288 [Maribacter vaceletii]|uniref:Uncharacterized protein n=1 Tax=Maribacter vaceletii TaxID=1206816 RepID=A0A495ECC8_9FLAO|nr:hypothetical protein [Maribacter vaceletii]RKR14213.1 hypothetical protein CLV91_0288 [Maribacter vaceletii]